MEKRSKKGFTILELCIVLAILSIISVLTVSFSLVSNKLTKSTTKKFALMQEIDIVQSFLDDWTGDMNLLSKNFFDGDRLTVQIEESSYYFEIKDGILNFTHPEKQETSFKFDAILSARFEVITKGEQLFFVCHANFDDQEVFTFFVYPRVGSEVGVQ